MNSATFKTPDGRLVEGRARCEVDGAKLAPFDYCPFCGARVVTRFADAPPPPPPRIEADVARELLRPVAGEPWRIEPHEMPADCDPVPAIVRAARSDARSDALVGRAPRRVHPPVVDRRPAEHAVTDYLVKLLEADRGVDVVVPGETPFRAGHDVAGDHMLPWTSLPQSAFDTAPKWIAPAGWLAPYQNLALATAIQSGHDRGYTLYPGDDGAMRWYRVTIIEMRVAPPPARQVRFVSVGITELMNSSEEVDRLCAEGWRVTATTPANVGAIPRVFVTLEREVPVPPVVVGPRAPASTR